MEERSNFRGERSLRFPLTRERKGCDTFISRDATYAWRQPLALGLGQDPRYISKPECEAAAPKRQTAVGIYPGVSFPGPAPIGRSRQEGTAGYSAQRDAKGSDGGMRLRMSSMSKRIFAFASGAKGQWVHLMQTVDRPGSAGAHRLKCSKSVV